METGNVMNNTNKDEARVINFEIQSTTGRKPNESLVHSDSTGRHSGGSITEVGKSTKVAESTAESRAESTWVDEAVLVRLIGVSEYTRYFAGQSFVRTSSDVVEVVSASGFLAKAIERRFGDVLRSLAPVTSRSTGDSTGCCIGLKGSVSCTESMGERVEGAAIEQAGSGAGRAAQAVIRYCVDARVASNHRGVATTGVGVVRSARKATIIGGGSERGAGRTADGGASRLAMEAPAMSESSTKTHMQSHGQTLASGADEGASRDQWAMRKATGAAKAPTAPRGRIDDTGQASARADGMIQSRSTAESARFGEAATGFGLVAGASSGSQPQALCAPFATRPLVRSGIDLNGEASRQRFETFVVGASNQMAHAAAWALASGDSPMLVVHGSCGMGKTHLLRAIVHEVLRRNPSAIVRWTSAEVFTNEFIQAVRANKVEAFRKVYRRCDVLCIDDVHFLASKEATQQELLHTLDAAGLAGTRVAMASDEHPRDVAKFNERLVSRCMSGPVVRIDPPDPKLRSELVRHLAARRGLALEDGAVALVAERSGHVGARQLPASVRDIEGMLIQIEAVRTLLPELSGEPMRDTAEINGVKGSKGLRVGAVLVRKALGLTEGTPQPRAARRPIPVMAIMETICKMVGADVGEVMGKSRHQRVVLARSMTAHLARRLTTMSFPEIARAMGRPNHSTIITAQKRLEREMAQADGGELGWLNGTSGGLSVRELAEELAMQITRAHA